MTERLVLERYAGGMAILFDTSSQYAMRIDPRQESGHEDFISFYLQKKAPFGLDIGDCVTCGNFMNYPQAAREIALDGSRVIAEIGIGLGGLLTSRKTLKAQTRTKVVNYAIDPTNYDAVDMLLDASLDGAFGELSLDAMGRVIELKRRVGVIRDPTKIRLINKTLQQAIAEDPSLEGIADAVVERVGASHHLTSGLYQRMAAQGKQFREFKSQMDLESEEFSRRGRKLLRVGGVYIHDDAGLNALWAKHEAQLAGTEAGV